MSTVARLQRRAPGRRTALVLFIAALAALLAGPARSAPAPGIAAFFAERSYSPGEVGILHVSARSPRLRLRIYRAGYGSDGPMQGLAVSRRFDLRNPARVSVAVGDWPSGFYYARLSAPGRVSYAPFVLRPRRLGGHRIAVVLPTNTWQAYNFLDGDEDGEGDSWYATPTVACVALARPFVGNGTPPHYHGYDRGFLRWLALHREQADFFAQDDLERASGADLARAYDLIVFPGHHEYVTAREYDVVERYRDLGGNLAFLSANNFFYRVERRSGTICRTGRWRDLGRPEARLVGIQYVDWNRDIYKNQPYVVVGTARAPWAFRGTRLHAGSSFGVYGIEIDARTADSPPGIRVLSRITDAFGPGKSAEMTYYTTLRGAKVFAAGVINFGGSTLWPGVSELMENLWRELRRP